PLRRGGGFLPPALEGVELADVQRRRLGDLDRRGDRAPRFVAGRRARAGYDGGLTPAAAARRSASFSRTSTRSAISWKARLCGLAGAAATMGSPRSPASHTSRASATSPSDAPPE